MGGCYRRHAGCRLPNLSRQHLPNFCNMPYTSWPCARHNARRQAPEYFENFHLPFPPHKNNMSRNDTKEILRATVLYITQTQGRKVDTHWYPTSSITHANASMKQEACVHTVRPVRCCMKDVLQSSAFVIYMCSLADA
jgi:hypothetical protein